MRKYEVHYHISSDHHGQPSEDIKEIECANDTQAKMMVEYDLEKTYPDAKITIKSVKEVK